MPTPEIPSKDKETTKTAVPTEKSSKKKFPCLKLLLVVSFVILLLLVAGTAVFFFLSSRKCNKDKKACQEELALTQIESEENKDESDADDKDKDCPECTCDCQDCVCPTGGGPCNTSFTSEENLMMEGWVKYTNETYNYSFKHPSEWMIMDTYPDSLEAGESLHFEFFVLAGDTLYDDILPDYPFSVEDGYVKEVYCTQAFQFRVTQPAPNEWEGVATYIVYNGTPYQTWVRFLDEGTSVTSDTIELYDLILKTFEFE